MPHVRKSPATERADELGATVESLAEILSIEGELSDQFRLAEPVRVELWVEHDDWVADAIDLNLHAFGATRAEALFNLRSQILVQHSRLLTLRNRLSPHLARQADRLEALVLR